MVVRLEDAIQKGDVKFLEIIEKYGWHVMRVRNLKGETEPEFSYSTGIYHNYGKPEIIIFGLTSDLCHSMINGYGNDIKERKAEYRTGEFYRGFLEDFDVFLAEGEEVLRKKYACWADWYYERKPFPIIQCVWPSTRGIWPWDSKASKELREMQPLFGATPQIKH